MRYLLRENPFYIYLILEYRKKLNGSISCTMSCLASSREDWSFLL
jgi:hypothetical protein